MEAIHRKILKALSLELRHLLEGYYDEEGTWHQGDIEQRLASLGVWRDRKPIPADELTGISQSDREARNVIDAYLKLRLDAGVEHSEAVAEFVRETAYTWANRLLILRCMEARGLIDEVILQKEIYGGRSLEHHRLAQQKPELCGGEDDGLFVVLADVFRRRSEYLPQLFDLKSPCVALRPSIVALKYTIALLSGMELIKGHGAAIPEVFQAQDALGWAYQYWNIEEKDRIFEKVKTQKGMKIVGADIIPVTQLYTEPYMVKFLVQNSLGATWMGMHPESKLFEKWNYYIRNANRASVTKKPIQEITFLDPACGSGHFLLEAFDLFYDMYLEEGTISNSETICTSILKNNLYGIEIDGRAVQIAEASLWMKAAEKNFTFRGTPTNLISTNIKLPTSKVQLDLFLTNHPEDAPLRTALEVIFSAMENVSELGSLLQIETPVDNELKYLKETRKGQALITTEHDDWIRSDTTIDYRKWRREVLKRLEEHFKTEMISASILDSFFMRSAGTELFLFDLLTKHYDVVATNPPYMGTKNMGSMLKKYVEQHYRTGKRDLYAAFILRCLSFSDQGGRVAMVTQQSWMFLRSFTSLRALDESKIRKLGKGQFKGLLLDTTIETLAHLGPHAFEEIGGEVVNISLFSLMNKEPTREHYLTALRLIGTKTPSEKDTMLLSALRERTSNNNNIIFRPMQKRFVGIDQSPLCYWLRERFFEVLSFPPLGDFAVTTRQIDTCNNERFLRFIWEISIIEDRWIPYLKAGGYSRWYRFDQTLLDWGNNGIRLKLSLIERFDYLKGNYGWLIKEVSFFKKGWTYSLMAQGCLGVRLLDGKHICDSASPSILPKFPIPGLGAVLNCRLISYILRTISSDMKFREGYIMRIPIVNKLPESIAEIESICINLKQYLVAFDPLERIFNDTNIKYLQTSLNIELNSVAVVLSTFEGLSEREVFDAYNIIGEDLSVVLNETGAPSGWFPLLQNYNMIPKIPESIIVIPSKFLKYIEKLECHILSSTELTDYKLRLRQLYEAGPGIKGGIEESESVPDDNDDADENAIGAHTPIPTETFLEELSQRLQIHPLSIFWLLKEGIEQDHWRCLPEERQMTSERVSLMVLQILGHRWPKQIESNEPLPDWVDNDGVIPLTECMQEHILIERIRERIAAEIECSDVSSKENEITEILGISLEQWLNTEFFKNHTKQYKRRPIAWQIQSNKFTARKKPAFACLVYYHKMDNDLIPKILSQYVRPLRKRYETELRSIESIPEATRSSKQVMRRIELQSLIDELFDFDNRLEKIIIEGFMSETLSSKLKKESLDKWCSIDGRKPPPEDIETFQNQEMAYIPDINDGVRVNIAPMQKAGVLAADVLAAKDVDKAIADRVEWRADERRWCREEKLLKPGWWLE